MSDDPRSLLSYERTARSRTGLFAGRFVALGAIGLVVGGFFICVEATALLSLSAGSALLRGDAFDIAVLLPLGYRLVLDVMLVFGSLNTLGRRPVARRMMVLFAKGQYVDAGVMAAAMLVLITAGQFGRFGQGAFYVMIGAAVLVLRLVLARIVLGMMQSIYADFYFGDGSANGVDVAITPRLVTQVRPQRANFIVKGTELANGKAVEYESKAKTRELALIAAVTMGLDKKSVTIEPIESIDAIKPAGEE